ncbi:hypothetical protein ECG_04624 [Echinococcus granulosus]|uniref:Secreted protein n=1 Tax=Echinococcus granulosus TaxID=6210 RepID=A0A068WHD1_ECHGR|nr:hypothetical protein ECG_04624 [Echinococcus granulosus]CDS17088.1 hypothetical protein EgrG_000981200 [Echinococcus granulosus]
MWLTSKLVAVARCLSLMNKAPTLSKKVISYALHFYRVFLHLLFNRPAILYNVFHWLIKLPSRKRFHASFQYLR